MTTRISDERPDYDDPAAVLVRSYGIAEQNVALASEITLNSRRAQSARERIAFLEALPGEPKP